MALAQKLGLGLGNKQLKPENFETREEIQLVKERLVFAFLRQFQRQNSVRESSLIQKCRVNPEASAYSVDGPHLKQSYKLSVQLGNNGHLVKSIMKTRSWWLHHSEADVNF